MSESESRSAATVECLMFPVRTPLGNPADGGEPFDRIDSNDCRQEMRIALNAQLLSFAESYRSGGISRVSRSKFVLLDTFVTSRSSRRPASGSRHLPSAIRGLPTRRKAIASSRR